MSVVRHLRRITSHRNLRNTLILSVCLALLPLIFHSPYALSTLILIGIYTIVSLGLCLLVGYAGQMSLGQAAFFGIGAYGSAILTTKFGWSPWLAMVAAAIITGVIAYLIGLPIFRLHGHYLALGTLAFGSIVHIVAMEWKAYTGGATGLPGVPRLEIMGAPLKTDLTYYYLVWAIAMVGLLLALNIVDSRFGRALRAIRNSEAAAESLGIDITHHKLRALVVSAVYASVAGSLYVHYLIFVSPDVTAFSASIRLILMVAVGGLASIWGAPFGTAAVLLLTTALREIVPLLTHHGSGEHQIIAYGLMLVVIMIFLPEGVAVAVAKAWSRSERVARIRRRLEQRLAGE